MKSIVIIKYEVVVSGMNHEEHDWHLHKLLQDSTIGVKLMSEKLEMGLDAFTFTIYHINTESIVIHPEKVRTITDMPALEIIGDLHRYLGKVTYVGKFILNLMTVIEPLHDLREKDVPWT